MKVLVTGGTGYIGSHTCVALIESGYEPVIVDNLYNSKESVVEDIAKITGKSLVFYKADIRDKAAMLSIIKEHSPEFCIHFAGLKAVGESVEMPLMYYDCNVGGTISLLDAMIEGGCEKIVFSSSATVYGEPETVPITEDFPLSTTNPYGATKLMIENILRDVCAARPSFRAVLLRYFNPVGAHSSGLIGENPKGIPNNLMPRIIQAAKGETSAITIFGNDYPTKDGTGVRDYIHVVDLAKGHIKALENVAENGAHAFNLGTGTGYSVLDLLNAFETASGINIKTQQCERRPGDVPTCYADPQKAADVLKWKAELGVEEMCSSAWKYAKDR